MVGTDSYRLLIALTDLSLEKKARGEIVEQLQLGTQEVRILPPGPTFRLRNITSQPARFIDIEF